MNDDSDISARAEKVSQKAMNALLALKKDHPGHWDDRHHLTPLFNALYIIMLRMTGLIEDTDARNTEAHMLRFILTCMNPDGGFYKYPGSPSNKSITRMILLSFRLALGKVDAGRRPPEWFARNDGIETDMEWSIRKAGERAKAFLRRKRPKANLSFHVDYWIFERIMRGFIDPRKSCIPVPVLHPRIWAWMVKTNPARLFSFFGPMFREAVPSVSILYGAARRRRQKTGSASPWTSILARHILSRQNENGSWYYMALYTMLSIMALRESGYAMTYPAIKDAMRYLIGHTCGGNGIYWINYVNTDLWSTLLGSDACLKSPMSGGVKRTLLPCIDFILRCQAPDGSFAYSSGAGKNPDNDTTAYALLVLNEAKKHVTGPRVGQIIRCIGRGLKYLAGIQGGYGGFCAFDPASLRGGRGPHNILHQVFLDVSTPDVTARVLHALQDLDNKATVDMTSRALRFLLRTQARNGAWWSRWYASYLPGAYSGIKPLSFPKYFDCLFYFPFIPADSKPAFTLLQNNGFFYNYSLPLC